ncbi:hypothetical protein [Candidatus Hodgkinia cicadicola]|uniref:hypothetical protein n=1 Tax=Candidatus Hodgkinia cicadicola TaxID=573658 RepID=UPI0011BAACCD
MVWVGWDVCWVWEVGVGWLVCCRLYHWVNYRRDGVVLVRDGYVWGMYWYLRGWKVGLACW